MDGLYTNQSILSDFAYNAFLQFGNSCDVMIASAFFSDSATVLELLERGCRVQLIVRLAAATSPDHLKRVQGRPGIQIRYFTDPSFHPKLYIFGASCALVGSANLTGSGLKTNQEVVISLTSEDPRFDELASLFRAYWAEAKALTDDDLRLFGDVLRRNRSEPDHQADSAVIEALGRHLFSNVKRGVDPPSRRQEFLDSYRRRYQSFMDAYQLVYEVYASVGRRMTGEQLPLRIEIDQWFSFIREMYAIGDAYHSVPLLTADIQRKKIVGIVKEFIDNGWPWLTEKIASHSYPLINSTLGTTTAIERASEEEIYEALLCVHAFHDRFRFYDGGQPTMRRRFLEDNGVNRIKKTLLHLLHGKPSDAVVRMAQCIFDEEYQLHHFGEMCVQETYGWVNKEDAPICNGRTLKSLRWLGFNVNAP